MIETFIELFFLFLVAVSVFGGWHFFDSYINERGLLYYLIKLGWIMGLLDGVFKLYEYTKEVL